MGRYTINTNTDDQKLKPGVRRRIEHRLAHMPGRLNTYAVTRKIVLAPMGGQQRFEDVVLKVQAGSMSEALRMADEAKASRDYRHPK
jgi:hypothetical protein